MTQLVDTAIRHAKPGLKTYILNDFDGLSLAISPTGYKSWYFRYSIFGKRRRITLGSYPEISLQEARQRRDEARQLVANNIDPLIQKRKDRQALDKTSHFKYVFEEWYDYRKLSLDNEGRQSTLSQMTRIFASDVLPFIGNRPISLIKRADMLTVLQRVEQRKAFSTAEKLRTWFNQLFRYALVKYELEINPARELASVALPTPPVKHNPHLTMAELPALLTALNNYDGDRRTQLGIKLLLLTAVRPGELRHAEWHEFDLEERLWRIPAEKVKQLKKAVKADPHIPPYIIPLPTQAVSILLELASYREEGQKYLLPHRSDKRQCMSENTLNGTLHRIGYKNRLTTHGIRGTISTALNEMDYAKDWIEAQLSHVDKDRIRASYNHASYVEQRREMMQAWADKLEQLWRQENGDNNPHSIENHSVLEPSLSPQPLSTADTPELYLERCKEMMLEWADKLEQLWRDSDSYPEQRGEMVQEWADKLKQLWKQENSKNNIVSESLLLSSPVQPELEPSIFVRPRVEQRFQPMLTPVQQERANQLAKYEAPHNLPVSTFARLAGKSRDQINRSIKAGKLLTINIGNRGQRIPDWQLEPLKYELVNQILQRVRNRDAWQIYDALTEPHPQLSDSPIEYVTQENLRETIKMVCQALH